MTRVSKVVNHPTEVEPELPEGCYSDDEDFELTEEQEAMLEESFAQIERGEYIDGDEAIRELRRRRGL